jgi:hypothetical protein
MAKVLDFFSKKDMATLAQQDYVTNDRTVDEKGTYLGKLPPNSAIVIRTATDELARKKVQIDALIDDFNALYDKYAYLLVNALTILHVDAVGEKFSLHKHDLYIDKDGNAWAVEKQSEEPTDM